MLWMMTRAMATALLEQLCRELPGGDTAQADDFDYGWFRERVQSVVDHYPKADAIYIWQLAMWHLDAAGLMPEELTPKFRT